MSEPNQNQAGSVNEAQSQAGLPASGGSAILPDWHRLSIRYDGKEIIGATVTCKRPENHEQMTALIRELLDSMTAPTAADPEVLGAYSPNNGCGWLPARFWRTKKLSQCARSAAARKTSRK